MPIRQPLRWALGLVTAAALATGCGHPASSHPSPAAAPSTATAPSPASPSPAVSTSSTTPVPSPSSTADAGERLLAMALPVPPGATAWKQPSDRPKNRTGVLNLAQYVAANYDPQWAETATRAATERGFVVAACQAWNNPDGSQTQVMLVQYVSATGAQAHYRGLRGLWTEDTSTTFFDDPDDRAAGLLHTKPIMDGMTYASLLTTRGNILVVITHFTPGAPDRDTAVDLFRRQLSALAG